GVTLGTGRGLDDRRRLPTVANRPARGVAKKAVAQTAEVAKKAAPVAKKAVAQTAEVAKKAAPVAKKAVAQTAEVAKKAAPVAKKAVEGATRRVRERRAMS